MRLGEKTKKALRIGAKVGGIGVAVLGGTRLASKEAMKPAVETTPSRSGGGLVSSSAQLRSGAQDFSSLATQLRQQQEAKSKRFF
jgi:hypothetical protein